MRARNAPGRAPNATWLIGTLSLPAARCCATLPASSPNSAFSHDTHPPSPSGLRRASTPSSGGLRRAPGASLVVARGEEQPTELTEKIRALYEAGVVPVAEIARIAGVHQRTLYKYVAKRGWRRRYGGKGIASA